MKKDNMCFEDTSVTYHDYEDKQDFLVNFGETKERSSKATEVTGSVNSNKNGIQVSVPSIRDVDTITTSDSQRQMIGYC